MTLRDLYWGWKARQQSEWARAGVIAGAAAAAFGGQFNPLQFIPPAFRPEVQPARPRTPVEVESEDRRAWAIMDQVFGKGQKRKR